MSDQSIYFDIFLRPKVQGFLNATLRERWVVLFRFSLTIPRRSFKISLFGL
jgi:hypothetical protein